jgi:hypothetical protein
MIPARSLTHGIHRMIDTTAAGNGSQPAQRLRYLLESADFVRAGGWTNRRDLRSTRKC